MKSLLGLLLFLLMISGDFTLPTPPVPMKCETCATAGNNCSGSTQVCTPGVDSCYSLLLDTKKGTPFFVKGCMSAILCAKLKRDTGNVISEKYGSFPDGAVIKDVACSKTVDIPEPTTPGSSPSFSRSSASFLLGFFALLAMRFFF